MTDERMDKMLKAYVDPQVEAFAFKEKKHKGLKAVSVIAAALLITVGIAAIPFPDPQGFSVVANAAQVPQELSADSPIAVGEISRVGSGGISGSDDVMYVTEDASVDITVKGENIKKVTYEVKGGMLSAAVKINDSDSPVTGTGASYTYNLESYENDGGYMYYDTLTFDYEAEPKFAWSDQAYLNITVGGDAKNYDKGALDRYRNNIMRDKAGFATDKDMDTLNEICDITQAYYEEVFRNVELYVTVEYLDGKTETQTVLFQPDWKLKKEPQKLLMYTYDERTRSATITHDVMKADGILSDDWHTFKLGENIFFHSTEDEDNIEIKLDISEDDFTPGYYYSIEGTLCGMLKM